MCVEINIGDRLPHTDRDDIWRTIRLVPFVCELVTDGIVLTEHEQILWLTPGELHSLDWAEADRMVLQNYFMYLDEKRANSIGKLARLRTKKSSTCL